MELSDEEVYGSNTEVNEQQEVVRGGGYWRANDRKRNKEKEARLEGRDSKSWEDVVKKPQLESLHLVLSFQGNGEKQVEKATKLASVGKVKV